MIGKIIFKLIDYYARSSFASLASNAMIEQSVLDNIQLSFRKRMVLRDMDKSFIKKVKK